jgi:hypothetical protein
MNVPRNYEEVCSLLERARDLMDGINAQLYKIHWKGASKLRLTL